MTPPRPPLRPDLVWPNECPPVTADAAAKAIQAAWARATFLIATGWENDDTIETTAVELRLLLALLAEAGIDTDVLTMNWRIMHGFYKAIGGRRRYRKIGDGYSLD